MKIDVQQAGTCRVNVIVEAEAGEIDPALRKVRAKYQQGVALPGFRKGHAPWERVEAIYGKAVKDDCDQSVMGTLYAAAREELKKGGREVAALANVEKLEYALGKGAQVTLAIDIDPTFDLPDISKWQVRKAEVAATEAELLSVPGIGEGMARAILDYREDFGGFIIVDQLLLVDGVSAADVAVWRDYFYIGE